MSQTTDLVTAEEFAKLPDDGCRYELVRGRVIKMGLAGFPHGKIAVHLGSLLDQYVRAHKLGAVAVDLGCHLERDPDTVRGPDISFIRAEQIPRTDPEGFWRGGPDLTVEIRSPGDTLPEIETKVDEYLSHGVRLVWAVDSRRKTVTVYRPLTPPRTLTVDEDLDGGDVLPGFRCRVREIFE
ncbi:MAG: Uma2 family endonuclease [Acidobacteria bacterium]|nr:Uma2 family endonuclease [Acidobacteriota bacterium]